MYYSGRFPPLKIMKKMKYRFGFMELSGAFWWKKGKYVMKITLNPFSFSPLFSVISYLQCSTPADTNFQHICTHTHTHRAHSISWVTIYLWIYVLSDLWGKTKILIRMEQRGLWYSESIPAGEWVRWCMCTRMCVLCTEWNHISKWMKN